MLDITSILMTVAPELWLALAGLIGVLLGAAFGERFNALSFKYGALSLFAAAALAALHFGGGEAFGGLVRTNTFVNFAKVIAFVLAGVALVISEGFLKRHETTRYEYALLIIFASLGMGITLSAADLMTLYMGIETLSLSSYVLAAFHRDSARSSEAGLKYFVLGALASGMLLYGASLVYGFTGTTSFAGIAEAGVTTGALFGMVLMIVGLAFKISAAPMHVWTQDVYEGAPTPVVAFFASAPKMASTVVFANVLFTVFGSAIDQWQIIVSIIAGLSMMIGSLGALVQTNIKRLLGYSSIANVGYALVAVAAAMTFAVANVLIRKLSSTEPTGRILFYYHVGGIILFAGPAAYVWVTPVGIEWIQLIAIGGLTTIGIFCFMRAFSVGEANAVGPAENLRLIYAAIFGFVLFAEVPTIWTALGAAIIVASTVYIAQVESKRKR